MTVQTAYRFLGFWTQGSQGSGAVGGRGGGDGGAKSNGNSAEEGLCRLPASPLC